MGVQIFCNEKLIFEDNGKWLHPLFKVDTFLKTELSTKKTPFQVEDLFLKDTVIGKAAALMIIHMGFRKCHGNLMSRLAKNTFEDFGVESTSDELIEAIECRTEVLLANINSPAEAWRMLKERADKAVKNSG
ncbi:MAG: DUF1893 domain-containing protein [Spirochaetales bacterium]|nr:DUF1893 domain-containing protein [Spirochaetales bacterium]